jgi:hypothetical protein
MPEQELTIEGVIDGPSGTLGLCALLTCGHYSSAVHEYSSDWDFPADSHICPTCGEDRQYDLRVQAILMEG